MGRIIHFEIHVDDMERAKKFYGEVFGWTFEDWSTYAGMPYFGAVTGDANEIGINGALIQRQGPPPEPCQSMNGYACTIGIGDYDSTEEKIISLGGKVALPKYARILLQLKNKCEIIDLKNLHPEYIAKRQIIKHMK